MYTVMSLFSRKPTSPLFEGRFPTFAAAHSACLDGAGYEKESVVAQAQVRTRKIQDSCLRDPLTCSPRVAYLLAAFTLPLAGVAPGSPLKVLDFGGGVGGVYLRLNKFLAARGPLQWDIVETSAMAAAGKVFHKDGGPHFATDLSAVAENSYHLILASGSLQYVEDPAAWFDRLCMMHAGHIVFDQVPWIDEGEDRLTVQTPVGAAGPAYPSWFFSRAVWMDRLQRDFQFRMKWIHSEAQMILDGKTLFYEGFVLERKTVPSHDH